MKMDTVTNFLKLLVKWGGVFDVMDDNTIVYSGDAEPVTVMIAKDQKKIMVLHENMPAGKHTFFNPLVETMGHSAERKWFNESRSSIIGCTLMGCIKRIIELALAEEDDAAPPTYNELELVEPYVKKVDVKMLKELDKLGVNKLLRLVYNKRSHTAQLHTELYKDDFLKSVPMRQKTIKFLRLVVGDLLATDNVHKDYKFKAKELGMPEIESVINIMSLYGNSIGSAAKTLLGLEFYEDELVGHLDMLTEYRKKCGWAIASTVQHDRTNTEVEKAATVKIGRGPKVVAKVVAKSGVRSPTIIGGGGGFGMAQQAVVTNRRTGGGVVRNSNRNMFVPQQNVSTTGFVATKIGF